MRRVYDGITRSTTLSGIFFSDRRQRRRNDHRRDNDRGFSFWFPSRPSKPWTFIERASRLLVFNDEDGLSLAPRGIFLRANAATMDASGPLRSLYKKLRRATETRRHRRRRTVATTTTTISLFLSDLRYTLRAQRLTETTIESFMRSIVVVKVVVVESGSGEDAVRDEE